MLAAVLDGLPDEQRHIAWIEEIIGFGVRRPGTSASAATAEWCATQLESMGYAVTRQPVPALTSHPGPARVVAWPVDDPTHRVEAAGLTMPFSTEAGAADPSESRRFRLVLRTDDTRPTAGDAVLEHVRLTELPTSAIDGAARARHDPAGEFVDHVHVLPFGLRLGKEIDTVVEEGAGAMVGVVEAPWVTADYFVPYDGVVRPIPGLWLDLDDGARLDALIANGPVEVEITTEVTNRDSVDHNIIATAPVGDADDWVVIGSHHDAPWASAVEDASGIAQVLAQARAWAAIEPADRPVSMAFLLTAAHMSEGAGTREFIRAWEHRDRIRFAIHLEHIAAEAAPDGAGGLRATDRAEVRWWFASAPDDGAESALVDSVARAIAVDDLDRSLVLPAEIFGPMPPTDGGFFHLAEVAMVNLLAAPMYLFDPADTVDMVHRPSLVPTSRAAARIVSDAITEFAEAQR